MADEVIDFRLTFGNTVVGAKIHAIESPSLKPTEEPKIIHAFRRKKVLIDNRFPAVTYEYPFVVYTEGNSVAGFLYDFTQFRWLWDLDNGAQTSAQTLRVTSSTGTVIIDFGRCWFADIAVKEPTEMLVYSAGMFTVKFVGDSPPIIHEV